MIPSKIVLLGYMGSGKSVIGSLLEKRLKIPFQDLDDYIVLRMQQSISSIFETKGELFFRKKERECLEKILSEKKPMIVSLGGGTPCYYDTMNFLSANEDVQTIYLKTSVPTLTERLVEESDQRPLISHLKSRDEITEFIGKHLFERNPYYSMAKLSVITDHKSAQVVVSEIEKLLT
jgi:shikimate kinase